MAKTAQILFISFVVLTSTLHGNVMDTCPTRCNCKKADNSTSCINTGLTFIPDLPDYVTTLIFDGNFLANVTHSTFTALKRLKISTLSLVNDDITVISKNAFENMDYLQSLDLSQNSKLTLPFIINAINSIQSAYFSSLTIDSLFWTKEPTDLWITLSRFNITYLSMNYNSFTTLDLKNVSAYFPHLTHLRIAFTSVQKVTAGYLPSLKILELQYNYIEIEEGFFGSKPNCYFPALEELKLDSNFINYFENRFYCLDNLKTLTLDKNPVKTIVNDTFANLTSLDTLSLSDLGNRLYKIESYAFRSKTLRNLIFSNNYITFDENVFNFYFDKDNIFKHTPKLQSLDVSGNYFNLSSDVLSRMILPAEKLSNLTLRRCFLDTLPNNIFYLMANLKLLDVSDNQISSWNGTAVFGNSTLLQKLLLQNNYIKVINETSFPVQSIQNLLTIDLSYNPLTCNCDILWLKGWIDTNKTIFEGYPTKYICEYPRTLYNTKLEDYNPKASECITTDNQTFLIVVASLTLIGTILILTASILYKARWHIRYCIYLSLLKRKGFTRLTEETVEYDFDGFVIYSDSDTKWVKQQLMHHMENEANIKLCIHHRDFHVGKLIVDNIAQNMSVSRKILIIVSRDMVKSDWCLFETRVAHEKFLNKEMNALVLIMLEDIPKQEMPTSLRSLVNSTTYIQWPRKEYDQPKFWTEIEAVFRRENI